MTEPLIFFVDLRRRITGKDYWPYTKWFIGPVHMWLSKNFPSWNAYYLGN